MVQKKETKDLKLFNLESGDVHLTNKTTNLVIKSKPLKEKNILNQSHNQDFMLHRGE